MKAICPRCGSDEVGLELTPKGPHFGKLVCMDDACRVKYPEGHSYGFIKWMPRPHSPREFEMADRWAKATPPCPQPARTMSLFD